MRLGIWDLESETLEVAVGLSLAFYRGALWTSGPLALSQTARRVPSLTGTQIVQQALSLLGACAQPYAPAWSQRLKELGF